LFGVFRSKS
jgi:dihydrofolate reductase